MLFIALLITTMISCTKDEGAEKEVAAGATTGFTWKENGGSVVQKAVLATFSTQYKTIMATTATGGAFEINLNGTTPATCNSL